MPQRAAPPGDRARQVLTGPDNYRRGSPRPCLEEAGYLDHARPPALALPAEAQAELAYLPPSPCRNRLEAMADRVVHRDN